MKLTGLIQVVVVEDGEQDETSEVARPESAPPPLSPQVHLIIDQPSSPTYLTYCQNWLFSR